jgi:membrane-bound lytic murein transglycosylase B
MGIPVGIKRRRSRAGLLSVLMLFLPLLAQAAPDLEFDAWLAGVKVQALAQGVRAETVDAAFAGLELDPRVLVFDARQPEFVQTFEQYLQARVTPARVKSARQYYAQNQKVLQAIGKRYQVDPQYLIAFWGLESSFGRYQGKYQVIRSLATLAYDPRRQAFFTRELLAALQVLDEGHVPLAEFVGGWAGAMGQNQFMPSSFLNFAQDFDGDGKKNIWGNRQDVWASIAYYLSQNNWQQGESWGMQVDIARPVDFTSLMPEAVPSGCRAMRSHTIPQTLAAWAALGVTPNKITHDAGQRYPMVVAEPGESAGYLVGTNFNSILRYNCANKYAVSIGLMADAIVSSPE